MCQGAVAVRPRIGSAARSLLEPQGFLTCGQTIDCSLCCPGVGDLSRSANTATAAANSKSWAPFRNNFFLMRYSLLQCPRCSRFGAGSSTS